MGAFGAPLMEKNSTWISFKLPGRFFEVLVAAASSTT